MTCTRGVANPTTATRYRLWSDSAGYCQNPICRVPLFVDLEFSGATHFAEVAHIIAASDGGPRGDAEMGLETRGAWDNLILLCSNCHTVVDRATVDFPLSLLRSWKSDRQEAIAKALGISAFDTRPEVRSAIEPYVMQNRMIHRLRGPDNDYRFDPEAEDARMWRRRVADTVIPNHRSILRIIDSNWSLLTEQEKEVVAEYRSHVEDLTDRHLGAPGNAGIVSLRYPSGMDELFG